MRSRTKWKLGAGVVLLLAVAVLLVTLSLPREEKLTEKRPVTERPVVEARETRVEVNAGATEVAGSGLGGGVAEAGGEEGSIGQLIGDTSLSDEAVAGRLAAMTLETGRGIAERTEAVIHLMNLATGEEARWLLPLVRDARFTDGLCERVLGAALNGEPEWQADLYLAALETRKAPEMQTRIRRHLAFLTDEDAGNDPKAWVEPIRRAKARWAAAREAAGGRAELE